MLNRLQVYGPGVFLLVALCSNADAQDKEKPALKEAKFQDITLSVPSHWVQGKPTSQLRLGQFAIPAVEGDPEPAELTIHTFGGDGGGAQSNIKRWIDQFETEKRNSEAKSSKCQLGEYIILEATGTYKKPIGPPIQGKTQPLPNARMLGVIIAVEGKGNYFLKLTGPAKTVAANADAFRKSFGGNAAEEKAWKTGG